MILRAPKGCPTCSVGGETFKVSKGVVKVPDELGPLLFAHGFVEVIPGAPTPEEIAAAEKAAEEADKLAEQELEQEIKRLAIEAAIEAKGKETPKGE